MDLVRAFASSLGMYAYYGPRLQTGTFGVALLSRYPLENPRTLFMYSEGEQTAAITAQISVGEVQYFLLVTHLGNGGPMIQQEQVLSRIAGQENVVAMGDFNFPCRHHAR
jgi:endonuclease/exonuclease/phosphatase family metal-dependent hydrolase